ncbi:MAG: hypothetical protein U0I02_01505 [Eubacterium sp.]|nr:hypothetical protein [Eubacterium sp.]
MKKSFLKKVLAAAMAVLMISSCVPLAAVAADEEVNYSSAIAAYKQKMSEAAASKTVYKNMAESYTYYMAAVKYNDGYDTSDANKALADKLAPATETTFAESNKYTGPETLSDLISEWKFNDTGNVIQPEAYQNMLSKSDLVNFKISNKNDNYYTAVAGAETFVWLYDGDFSNMSAPLSGGYKDWASSANYYCLYKFYPTSSNIKLKDNWYFNWDDTSTNDTANNWWWNNTSVRVNSTDVGEYKNSGGNTVDTKKSSSIWIVGSNIVQYTGDGFDSNSYYTTLQMGFTAYRYWKAWGNGKTQTSINTGNTYIINYKKVSDAIQNAASTYFANIDSYTESSMITLLQAIDSLTSQKYTFGVQDGDNGAVSEANVQTLANTLSSKVDTLNSAGTGLADRADVATYLAAFKNAKANFANGNSVDSQNWTYSSWNAFVADYNKYSVIDPYNTVKSSETETVTMPQAISAYNALSPVANYEAYNAIVEAVKQQDMNAFTESYIKSDSSVYGLIGQYGTNASSITFNNGVANGVTETTSTDATASAAYVNVNGTVWKNATQTELDHYVGAVKSALTEALGDTTGAKRNSYTVTVTEYTNDVAGAPSTTTKYFGDNFSVAGLDSTVAKIVVNGKEFPATDSFTVRIQSNTDIKVYKTDNASLADKKAVQVQDIYGKSAQAYYLDSNATVVFNGNQFTSGSASYQAQEIGSYAFVKWQVNGKDVAPGATMAVSEIQTIKPVYKVSTEKTYNVTLDETAVGAVNTKNIYYDSKVVVKPQDGAAALAAKIGDAYYVVNYGAGEYTFYGCGDVNLYSVMPSGNGYTVHGESLDAATAEKVKEQKPFVWSVKDDNGTKLTTYSTFSNGTKIIEAGTMYYVSETAPSEESFKLGNAGVRSVAAKNPNAESSQYWLGITYGSKKLYTRAYVKYEATVNGTTVQVIDYGNIVSNAK